LRTDVAFAMAHYEMSERQACKLVDLNRSSYRYEPRPDHNAELRQTLVELARQKPRYGYRRLHAVLSRRGSPVSPQRVYRLYKAEGLMVRRLRRKRLSRLAMASHLVRSNQEWALDFVCDSLATGRLNGGGRLYARKPFLRSRWQFIEPSGDACAGGCDRTSGKAGNDSLRQWAGVDQPAFSELVRRAEDSTDPYPARAAHAERPCGELQRSAAG